MFELIIHPSSLTLSVPFSLGIKQSNFSKPPFTRNLDHTISRVRICLSFVHHLLQISMFYFDYLKEVLKFASMVREEF